MSAAFRQQVLNAFRLTAADAALAEKLQRDLIRPNLPRIVDTLGLNTAMADYVKSLGVRFSSPEYFAHREAVGRNHQRLGLPLHTYQGALARLQETLLMLTTDPRLASFISRITALDASVVTECYYRQFQQDANTDELTQIPNRRCIVAHMESVIDSIEDLSLLMIDLDHFKRVNDQHGHLVGDHVLVEVVQRIRNSIRRTDWLGRFGGEEFLAVLHHTDLPSAVMIAEDVRRQLSDDPVRIGNLELSVTLSIGVAQLAPGTTPMETVEVADVQLYAAKRAGRNQVSAATMGHI